MNVGWIGLGAMGLPMANRVAAGGFPVSGFDIWEPAGLAPGVTFAPSAASAVHDADIVALMVATPTQAQAVLDGGLLAALRPGTVVIVLATVGHESVTDIARQLAERDVRLVDAPVSGGVARAGAGDLLIMVGGSDADIEFVRPVLDTLASTIAVAGSTVGDGQKLKLVNQLLCGVHIAVAGEALAFARSLGIDPAFALTTLSAGAAASFMLSDRGPRMVEGTDEVRSAVDIFVKDLGLVDAAAEASGAPVPIAAAARRIFAEASERGLGRTDDSNVIRIYEGDQK